jgi:hypothetical protein
LLRPSIGLSPPEGKPFAATQQYKLREPAWVAGAAILRRRSR